MKEIECIADRLADELIVDQCICGLHQHLPRVIATHIHAHFKQAEEGESAEKEKLERIAYRIEVCDAVYKSIAPEENRMESLMQEVWREEEQIIIANLKKMKKAWLSKDAADQVLYSSRVFEKKIINETEGIFVDVLDKESNRLIDQYSIEVAWDVENPEVQNWLKTYIPKFAKDMEKESLDKLKGILSKAFEEGRGIPEIVREIRGEFEAWDKYRATKIARSEIIRSSNAAAKNVYLQSGQVEKMEWVASVDDRVCFPKNIKVITENGEKNIQNIKKGEIVLTHNGWQKVQETMKRKYNGKMIKIETNDDRKLICTEDHPIYEMRKGWVKAKDLFCGDKLKSYRNEIIEILNVSNFKFFNSDNFISKPFKFLVSFNIFRSIRMPIISINFKTNLKIRKKEIYTKISSYLIKFFYFIFLNKINIQSFERFFNNRFNSCFSRIFTITRERAKSSYSFCRRNYSKFLLTIKTFYINRWPSAFFRAMKRASSSCWIQFSTSFTCSISRPFCTTFYTANSIPVRYAFINRKGLSTNRTFFSNPLCFFSTICRTIFFRASSSTSIKRLSALRTDFGLTRFRRFVIAGCRAVGGIMMFKDFIFRSKFFTTLLTYIHDSIRYIKRLIKTSQACFVYNLEIENSHTFYANGILVHNCPFCEELDGRIISIKETFFDLGDSMTIDVGGKSRTMEFTYTDIEYPPAHSQCRCTISAKFE